MSRVRACGGKPGRVDDGGQAAYQAAARIKDKQEAIDGDRAEPGGLGVLARLNRPASDATPAEDQHPQSHQSQQDQQLVGHQVIARAQGQDASQT